MKIHLIIAQYQQSYPDELMPNVVDAWDEFTLEDNHEGYTRALKAAQARVGTDYEAVREATISVPGDAVLALFETPELPSRILP